MQIRQRILSTSLSILIAIPVFICDRASAANRWWDGRTIDIVSDGNAASTGGTGTWNTTLLNCDAGAAPHVAWNNAGNDTTISGGLTLESNALLDIGNLGGSENASLASGIILHASAHLRWIINANTR